MTWYKKKCITLIASLKTIFSGNYHYHQQLLTQWLMKMFKDRLEKYTTGLYYYIVFNIKLLKHGIILKYTIWCTMYLIQYIGIKYTIRVCCAHAH